MAGGGMRGRYHDLAVGRCVTLCDSASRERPIVLEAVVERGARVNVDGACREVGLGHFRSPRDPNPPGEMGHVVHVNGLTVGLEVTNQFSGTNAYETTTIALAGDARLYVEHDQTVDAVSHRFPIPAYDWNYSDNWLTPTPYGFHLGIDLYAPRGTMVVAACGGTIIDIREFDPDRDPEDYWGRMLAVHGNDGYVYVYAHCDSLVEGIAVGRRIEAGDPVGPEGKAGFESKNIGPHLHFEMYACGEPEKFRFAFEPIPTVLPTPLRVLALECRGFVVNPRLFLHRWFADERGQAFARQ